ncbi:MAG TPA: bifunctional pyr operon transcriptional regulator/uracil phosphoribosyltransferase PyrR [Candidatus Binatia bacterium]|nr:bifunctional pyr operon transcriptional regulator/uracil phosphoribosyltransferase PyrR [Candidatus Binatia bacterium]
MSGEKQILFESDEVARTIARMTHEIIEKAGDLNALVLIGIRSRGVHLARRIARKIEELERIGLPLGILDLTAYRDDRSRELEPLQSGPFQTPVGVDGKTVVLIDDVIFRGRTIRAALDAVLQFGQPKRILVAVLVDRGSRQLPIRADVIGKNIGAEEGDRVNVMLREADGIDQIALARWDRRSGRG